jgi:fumarate reductase subunit C
MSTRTTHGAARTRTAPPRKPGGWPLAHPRYRLYLLFASTSVFMAAAVTLLLSGVEALGRGKDAWRAYLAWLGLPGVRTLAWICFFFTLFFTVRWAWLTRKIAAGRVGPIPRPPLPMFLLFLGTLSAFFVSWIVTLMIVGGALL